jgi:tungstate transport system substrate-binding protein
MASTTSTEQSGLFAHLLPEFKKASGIDVKVVALGTGQALDTARRGDADVVFVHDQVAEEKFVAEGFGVKRYPVMYNDFVLVGPKGDPAGDQGQGHRRRAEEAGRRQRRFRLARRQERHPRRRAAFTGSWPGADAAKGSGYKECGCGMGPALNMRSLHRRLCAGRPRHLAQLQEPRRPGHAGRRRQALFNQYGVMVVNPAKHPHVKAADAQKFVDWVVSPAGQNAIASYKIGGEQLFFPNAVVEVGISTPKADPAGDYAWALFGKADALQSGATARLQAKALNSRAAPIHPSHRLGGAPTPGSWTRARRMCF